MKQEEQSQQERKPLPGDNLPEPLKEFEASLTGFEKLEFALDTWLATDTGEHTEQLLQATATAAAATINDLIEQGRERGQHGQDRSPTADTEH